MSKTLKPSHLRNNTTKLTREQSESILDEFLNDPSQGPSQKTSKRGYTTIAGSSPTDSAQRRNAVKVKGNSLKSAKSSGSKA